MRRAARRRPRRRPRRQLPIHRHVHRSADLTRHDTRDCTRQYTRLALANRQQSPAPGATDHKHTAIDNNVSRSELLSRHERSSRSHGSERPTEPDSKSGSLRLGWMHTARGCTSHAVGGKALDALLKLVEELPLADAVHADKLATLVHMDAGQRANSRQLD